MSSSTENIEKLRHNLREMENKLRQSEKIRKCLAEQFVTANDNVSIDPSDLNSMKEEIHAAWIREYESEVRRFYEYDGETEDNCWNGEVVGDVMDELRSRVVNSRSNEENGSKSEIDLQSMMDILDQDAKELGVLAAELLTKFFPRQTAMEFEKRRNQRSLPEAGDEAGCSGEKDEEEAEGKGELENTKLKLEGNCEGEGECELQETPANDQN